MNVVSDTIFAGQRSVSFLLPGFASVLSHAMSWMKWQADNASPCNVLCDPASSRSPSADDEFAEDDRECRSLRFALEVQPSHDLSLAGERQCGKLVGEERHCSSPL